MFLSQAVPLLDACPPLHPVVSLPPGVPPHELLLRCEAVCRGGPAGPQPPTGADPSPPPGGSIIIQMSAKLLQMYLVSYGIQ